MTKVAVRVPSYRRHKATGQAVVSLAGRDIYLGKFNSAASRAEYNRLIAEWAAHHGTLPQPSHDLTVTELLAAFITQAPRTHSKKDLENFRLAARPLKSLYGPTSIVEFGPIRLKTVRQQMIDAQLARKTINERINRLRYIFKWGVENEIVPATVLHALQAVAGLRYGRSEAKETEPVKPVPDAFVDAILPHVSPQIAAMVELQRITAMRSGEVTIMRVPTSTPADRFGSTPQSIIKTSGVDTNARFILGRKPKASCGRSCDPIYRLTYSPPAMRCSVSGKRVTLSVSHRSVTAIGPAKTVVACYNENCATDMIRTLIGVRSNTAFERPTRPI